jgi:hypothetical protein
MAKNVADHLDFYTLGEHETGGGVSEFVNVPVAQSDAFANAFEFA